MNDESTFSHPYSLETARWIRDGWLMEKDPEKQSAFLMELADQFGADSAEILQYISNDYRVFIRDDQMWPDYKDDSWDGAVYSAGRAWGKALRDDQVVKTPRGWKPIGEIKVGDAVLDPEGDAQVVEAVYPQGKIPLLSITTHDGRKSICCDEHLWTGRFGKQYLPRSEEGTFTTSQIVKKMDEGFSFFIPKISGDASPEVDLPIDPYILGVLLGDGNMTERHVCLTTADDEIIEEFHSAGYTTNKRKGSKYDYGVHGIIGDLKALGLQGKNSHTKFIPEKYLAASYSQRLALLQGLMDSDGTIEKTGRAEYYSSGDTLCEDFQKLVWSLGGSAKIISKPGRFRGKVFPSKRVRLQFEDTSKIFRLAHKASRGVYTDCHRYLRFVKYERVESAEATCITVSGKKKLFVTDNYLVTHNTWAGSPAAVEYAIQHPGCLIGLLAPTFAMGRDNMIMGASGIIELSPRGFKPEYNKSEGLLSWPNGSKAKLYSAENGDRVRGQNFSFIWADEFAFFKFTGDDKDLWKMAKLALRAGNNPKFLITTSPRPIKELKDLYEDSKKKGSRTLFTTGTTFDNYTLPESYLRQVRLDKGTSLYNQEILGMILDENPGAIFSNEDISRHPIDTSKMSSSDYDVKLQELINSMDTIVVSVDPNVVEDITSDETGITVIGRRGDKGFVFKDASRRGKIKDIYQDIVDLYHRYQAECVVVETNNGGDFIPAAIFNIDEMVVVKKVFASRGKKARAEPIGLLYERKKIVHIGIHRDLEAQMTEYNPQVAKKSPDRLDSLVWGLTFLFPASMNGLFDSIEAEHSMDLEGKGKVKDLHEAENRILDQKKKIPLGVVVAEDESEEDVWSLY